MAHCVSCAAPGVQGKRPSLGPVGSEAADSGPYPTSHNGGSPEWSRSHSGRRTEAAPPCRACERTRCPRHFSNEQEVRSQTEAPGAAHTLLFALDSMVGDPFPWVPRSLWGLGVSSGQRGFGREGWNSEALWRGWGLGQDSALLPPTLRARSLRLSLQGPRGRCLPLGGLHVHSDKSQRALAPARFRRRSGRVSWRLRPACAAAGPGEPTPPGPPRAPGQSWRVTVWEVTVAQPRGAAVLERGRGPAPGLTVAAVSLALGGPAGASGGRAGGPGPSVWVGVVSKGVRLPAGRLKSRWVWWVSRFWDFIFLCLHLLATV